jgi:hypothetical protein
MITEHVCTPEECPEPGFYYVTVKDAGQYWKMAGPYATHREALGMVKTARELTGAHGDPRGMYMEAFWGWGTARLMNDHPCAGEPGLLNEKGLLK